MRLACAWRGSTIAEEIVIDCGRAPSGGSNTNPRLEVKPDTVLEWCDVAQGTALSA